MAESTPPRKRVILVDDEPAAIASLRAVIGEFEDLEIVAEVADGASAIRTVLELQPDIVFLDIEMPEVGGFEVAKATREVGYQLVFVTAYDQYALDAFDTQAIDYLLKPVRPALIEKCITKILHQETLALEALEKPTLAGDSLTLSDGNALRVLRYEHICYIEGIGRYRRVHLSRHGAQAHRTETIISDTTLDEFASQLPPQQFVRLHRSYIVRLEQITGLTVESRRHFVKLADIAIKVPVSRGNVSSLKSAL
ncbi:MAG: LytTR family DNA-binding domain-containing protein [Pseudomonadota bacterium]